MRNQNLPPIKYVESEPAMARPIEIKYRNEAVVELKASLAELAEAEAAVSQIRTEMVEDAEPGSRMTFVSKEKRDEKLYGPGLKGRTIADGDEL